MKGLRHELANMKHHILFIHAMTGCDTTSALYNQGKRKVVKLAPTKRDLHPLMDMFVRASSSHDDVTSAGERFMLPLYGADKFATLNKYRHVAYKRGLASTPLSIYFQLSRIRPTSAAARQHPFRVYLQIQEWMGHILTPTEWGWQDHDQTIVPMATNQPAAPLQLMNIVTCDVGLVLVMHFAAGKQEWCATIYVSIAWECHATMHLKWILTTSKLTQNKNIELT